MVCVAQTEKLVITAHAVHQKGGVMCQEHILVVQQFAWNFLINVALQIIFVEANAVFLEHVYRMVNVAWDNLVEMSVVRFSSGVRGENVRVYRLLSWWMNKRSPLKITSN